MTRCFSWSDISLSHYKEHMDLKKTSESTDKGKIIPVNTNVNVNNKDFVGKYYIKTKLIDQGYKSEIHLIRDLRNQRHYALKKVNKDNSFSETEYEMLSRVSHQNIIKLFEKWEDNKHYFLILEYCPDRTLFHLLNHSKVFNGANSCLTPVQVSHYMYQSVIALFYLYKIGIMHRDVKPENILLTENRTAIRLCDLGLSTYSKESSELCGTIEYIAPEIVSQKVYNYKVDIWALGIMTYELLMGELPFEAEDDKGRITKIIIGMYPPPRCADPTANQLVIALLNPKPELRPDYPSILKSPFIRPKYNL